MSEAVGLASRIRSYFFDLDQVVERTLLLAEKAIKSGDDGYWDGVALNLHSFYSSIEKIFEDISRTMDRKYSLQPRLAHRVISADGGRINKPPSGGDFD